MSELSDERIQQALEEGGPLSADLVSAAENEAEVYRLIFEGLKRDESASIPPDFSAMVVQKIEAKNRFGDIGFYSLIAMIAVAGLAGIYYLLKLLDENSANQYVAFAVRYKWVLIYGLGFVLVVQYLDQRIKRGRWVYSDGSSFG